MKDFQQMGDVTGRAKSPNVLAGPIGGRKEASP
jgi:hypothetical protein